MRFQAQNGFTTDYYRFAIISIIQNIGGVRVGVSSTSQRRLTTAPCSLEEPAYLERTSR